MKTTVFCLVFTLLMSPAVSARAPSSELDKLTEDEMVPLALKDCIYYHFDECFDRIKEKIDGLEDTDLSIENPVEWDEFLF